ncbi:putative 3-oxoacyl-reductase [Mollisia scopiformis]|uniref:Putative 3-oxoacyl-reductase n=1 Tax=Mollisia scopiformis TaxID=149040 RepID=A0A194XAW6_MOLSC|nr:putative 3-oxoacyl-reductase [Mollisia scopiformis]KUJ17313.1 putative 3-oxoacyl-reductase [Mollisia scopiformis]
MTFVGYLFRQVFVHPSQIPSDTNLEDQTIIITGANSGIGLEAARQCVRMKAKTLILAVRSSCKGEAAKKDILSTNPGSSTQVEIWILDMESFESVLAFGERASALPFLNIAMLNAGVFKFEWTVSESSGIESSLQVNHLSTALLSLLLLPVLRKTSQESGHPARLTITSSEVHMWTPFKEQKAEKILDRLNDKQFFSDSMDRYSVSKLVSLMWIRELASRVPSEAVTINLINPGSVDTGLHRDGNKFIQTFDRVVGRTPEEGGRLLIDAAVVKGENTHGKYLSEAKVTNMSAFVRSKEGEKIQKRLWDETAVMLESHVPQSKLEEMLRNVDTMGD